MNTFLIGSRLEVHHSPDWTGVAFLSFDDAEHRIPGEAAQILIERIRSLEREGGLHEVELKCTACGSDAGRAWLPGNDQVNAVCTSCVERVSASS